MPEKLSSASSNKKLLRSIGKMEAESRKGALEGIAGLACWILVWYFLILPNQAAAPYFISITLFAVLLAFLWIFLSQNKPAFFACLIVAIIASVFFFYNIALLGQLLSVALIILLAILLIGAVLAYAKYGRRA